MVQLADWFREEPVKLQSTRKAYFDASLDSSPTVTSVSPPPPVVCPSYLCLAPRPRPLAHQVSTRRLPSLTETHILRSYQALICLETVCGAHTNALMQSSILTVFAQCSP